MHDLNMAIRVMKPIFQLKNIVIINKLELNIYNYSRNTFAHIFATLTRHRFFFLHNALSELKIFHLFRLVFPALQILR